MKKYMTVSGDTWDNISFKEYSSYKQMDELLKANSDYIETLIFKGGIVLNIPDVKVEVSSSLPPWKRGV